MLRPCVKMVVGVVVVGVVVVVRHLNNFAQNKPTFDIFAPKYAS